MAGLGAGLWADAEELAQRRSIEKRFRPAMAPGDRQELLNGWQNALRQAMVHD